MGASPLYVYMYVAMNNMLVLLYSSRGEKKKGLHKPTLTLNQLNLLELLTHTHP